MKQASDISSQAENYNVTSRSWFEKLVHACSASSLSVLGQMSAASRLLCHHTNSDFPLHASWQFIQDILIYGII